MTLLDVQTWPQPYQEPNPAAPAAFGCGLMVLLIVAAALLAVVAVIGLVFLIRWAVGTTAACPSCGKGYARERIGKKLLERKKCFGLVNRSSSTSSSGWVSTGQGGTVNMSGSSHWKERVPVVRTTHLMTYECKFCGHRWRKEEVTEAEDFDIERA